MAFKIFGPEAHEYDARAAVPAGAAPGGGSFAIDNFRFFRYALVGVLATGVHYALLLVLVELAGMNAGLSTAIGASCGAATGYAGNRRFTFSSRARHGQTLLRFVLVAVFCAIASASIVWAGTERLSMHYLGAQLTATALILWIGFALNRRWTFV